MKIIKTDAVDFVEFFRKLRQRGGAFTPELLSSVAEIVSNVAARGDEALFHYTAKFDKYKLIEVATQHSAMIIAFSLRNTSLISLVKNIKILFLGLWTHMLIPPFPNLSSVTSGYEATNLFYPPLR